jgi:hypothetical protein
VGVKVLGWRNIDLIKAKKSQSLLKLYLFFCYNLKIKIIIMLPKFIKPFLWSNDFKQIDPEKDKQRIILNILNIGPKKATDWLFDFYSKSEIKKILINQGAKGELSDKSLNYWTLILNIDKNKLIKSRF